MNIIGQWTPGGNRKGSFLSRIFGRSGNNSINIPAPGETISGEPCPACHLDTLVVKSRNTAGIAGSFVTIDAKCENCGFSASPSIPIK